MFINHYLDRRRRQGRPALDTQITYYLLHILIIHSSALRPCAKQLTAWWVVSPVGCSAPVFSPRRGNQIIVCFEIAVGFNWVVAAVVLGH